MAIKYITFECVSRCDMDCGFCFSYWRDGAPEVGTEKAKDMIRQLHEQGLEAINYTGGEPLLRKDLPELLRFSKDLELTTIVTTDGIPLRRRLGEIADKVDYLGLPLDSADGDIHNEMRITKATNDHYGLILSLLDTLHRDYSHIGVKINTVVTKRNLGSIGGIGKLVRGRAVSWKLSQFLPAAYGALHRTNFEITDKEYDEEVRRCQEANSGVPIIVAPANSCDECCRVLSANGELMQPCGNKLVSLGGISTLRLEEITRGFNEEENIRVLNNTYLAPK